MSIGRCTYVTEAAASNTALMETRMLSHHSPSHACIHAANARDIEPSRIIAPRLLPIIEATTVSPLVHELSLHTTRAPRPDVRHGAPVLLLVAQRHRRVDTRRAPRGEHDGDERDAQHQHRRRAEHDGTRPAHTDEERREHSADP